MISQEELKDYNAFISKLLLEFESMDTSQKKRYAMDMLKRIGALNEDGTAKEQIVTGDFFGW